MRKNIRRFDDKFKLLKNVGRVQGSACEFMPPVPEGYKEDR